MKILIIGDRIRNNPKQRFKNLPKHMQTKKWIESEIAYERVNDGGAHTYHKCECGRKSCRASMCDLCWEELLKELIK